MDLTVDVMTRSIRRDGTRCVYGRRLFSAVMSCLIGEINTLPHFLEGSHSVWRCWGRHLQYSTVECGVVSYKGRVREVEVEVVQYRGEVVRSQCMEG